MPNSRIDRLLGFLAEDPNDAFTLYALALEYISIDIVQARSYFEKLLTHHAAYLATYYHAAKLYEDLDEQDMARQTYEQGIALSKEQNNLHTLRELENAYQQFLLEDDF